MGSSRDWVAFVDESGSNSALDPDTYIFAAAIADQRTVAASAEVMHSLRLRRQKKVHWRDESPERQSKVIAAVASLELEHLVVVRSCEPSERPERRRRQCLEHLCWSLQDLGVTQMTLESRGQRDDRRDLEALQTFRARKVVTGELRMEHRPGPAEPMLWVPDTVCGAVVADRTGNPEYMNVIRTACTIIEVS